MCFRPPQVKKKIIRCPMCGFMVNEGDKQCKKCGADLTQKPTDEKGKTDNQSK